jgi:hypothetical protein
MVTPEEVKVPFTWQFVWTEEWKYENQYNVLIFVFKQETGVVPMYFCMDHEYLKW